jgi:hypothetical protein
MKGPPRIRHRIINDRNFCFISKMIGAGKKRQQNPEIDLPSGRGRVAHDILRVESVDRSFQVNI